LILWLVVVATVEPDSLRQDYLKLFKILSTAMASRDLKRGVETGQFIKTGDKHLAVYKDKNSG
jgi:hypothetical protein